MPIRVDYSPIGAGLSLARQAGLGRRTQQGQATDIALLDLASRMKRERDQRQASERAFALQTAMAKRVAQTPMSPGRTSPIVDPVLARIQNDRAYKEGQQTQQLSLLENMRQTGEIDQAAFDRNRLRILRDETLRFGEDEASVSEKLFGPRAQVRMLQEQLKTAQAWAADPDITDDRRTMYQDKIKELTSKINTVTTSVTQGRQPASSTEPTEAAEATGTARAGVVSGAAASGGRRASVGRLAGTDSKARMKAAISMAKLQLPKNQQTPENIKKAAMALYQLSVAAEQ